MNSSDSLSPISSDDDDSQSRECQAPPIPVQETPTKSNLPEPVTPEEEEGEIKDDEEPEESMKAAAPNSPRPATPPLPPKKANSKKLNKPVKKANVTKKRKMDSIVNEFGHDDDDLDNSTLAKRKKK